MKRLLSTHAEDVGGFIVEPGAEFDESEADSEIVKRLEEEGKVMDAGKATRSKKEG